jgi:Ankyrin repeats (3 copies)
MRERPHSRVVRARRELAACGSCSIRQMVEQTSFGVCTNPSTWSFVTTFTERGSVPQLAVFHVRSQNCEIDRPMSVHDCYRVVEDFLEAGSRGDLAEVKRIYERYECYRSDLLEGFSRRGWTALHRITDNVVGRLEIVQYLVETCGANVHEANVDGDTPLHLASWDTRNLAQNFQF